MKTGKILFIDSRADVNFGLDTPCTEVVVVSKGLFGRKKMYKGRVYYERNDL